MDQEKAQRYQESGLPVPCDACNDSRFTKIWRRQNFAGGQWKYIVLCPACLDAVRGPEYSTIGEQDRIAKKNADIQARLNEQMARIAARKKEGGK